MEGTVFRLIKFLIQIVFVFAIVALIFNFKYDGKSAREYAKEWGGQLVEYGKNLYDKWSNKDLKKELIDPLQKKTEQPAPLNQNLRESEKKSIDPMPQESTIEKNKENAVEKEKQVSPRREISPQDKQELKKILEEKK